MTTEPEFVEFPKIARWSRDIVITEKIDGANAGVFIADDFETMRFASRSRWITPGKQTDNHGFARWCEEHREELLKLGPGMHWGEWWGQGIQRKYGLDHKRFSLFNVARWTDDAVRPACCHVVPTLYTGPNSQAAIDFCMTTLETAGSYAAPGFPLPEGIVIFHTASGQLFKKTVKDDERGKNFGH